MVGFFLVTPRLCSICLTSVMHFEVRFFYHSENEGSTRQDTSLLLSLDERNDYLESS